MVAEPSKRSETPIHFSHEDTLRMHEQVIEKIAELVTLIIPVLPRNHRTALNN